MSMFPEKNSWKKERSVLLVIDMQVDFVSEIGYLGKTGIDLTPVKESVDKIRTLVNVSRGCNIPVIYTRTVHERFTDSTVWKARNLRKASEQGICAAGTAGTEIIDELKPIAGERVVVKHRYDAMLGTDLPVILRALDARRIFVTGTQTNLCVDSTARHLFMEDYDTILIEECVSTPYRDMHLPFLKNFHENFGEVSTMSRVLKYMESY